MLNNFNIIATYLVRNDHDILRDSIVHNLDNGVDAIIVTEHNSSKESSEILDEFRPYILRRIIENDLGYNQSTWVTRMARIASRFNPNWIVHCDADELWCGLNTINVSDDIKAIYSDYWYNCMPYSIDEFDIRNAEFYEYPFESSIFGIGMQAKRKIVHRPDSNIVIYQGNHGCSTSVTTIVDTVKIKHYPVRTFEQFKTKVITGYAAYIASGLPDNFGSHWRRWYNEYINDRLLDVYKSLLRKREC